MKSVGKNLLLIVVTDKMRIGLVVGCWLTLVWLGDCGCWGAGSGFILCSDDGGCQAREKLECRCTDNRCHGWPGQVTSQDTARSRAWLALLHPSWVVSCLHRTISKIFIQYIAYSFIYNVPFYFFTARYLFIINITWTMNMTEIKVKLKWFSSIGSWQGKDKPFMSIHNIDIT